MEEARETVAVLQGEQRLPAMGADQSQPVEETLAHVARLGVLQIVFAGLFAADQGGVDADADEAEGDAL